VSDPVLPAGGRITRYAFTVFETANDREDLYVEARDRTADQWAILSGTGGCWTRDRVGFEYESMPSNRDADFLTRARWTLAEALVEVPAAIAFKRHQDGRLARWFLECREHGIVIHVPSSAEVDAIIDAAMEPG
jgi:hypothetical protein